MKQIINKRKKKKWSKQNKKEKFMIFIIGLTLFIIGWIQFFQIPYGLTLNRGMSLLTILFGGFMLWSQG